MDKLRDIVGLAGDIINLIAGLLVVGMLVQLREALPGLLNVVEVLR